MPYWAHILFAMILGGTMSYYMVMNSKVAGIMGSSITANVLFYGIGFISTVIFFVTIENTNSLLKVKSIPYPLFLTGFLSAIMVLGMTYLIPILGPRKLFLLIVGGQVLMAMLMSHFQWLGVEHDPINLKKVLGAILVLGGVLLTTSQ